MPYEATSEGTETDPHLDDAKQDVAHIPDMDVSTGSNERADDSNLIQEPFEKRTPTTCNITAKACYPGSTSFVTIEREHHVASVRTLCKPSFKHNEEPPKASASHQDATEVSSDHNENNEETNVLQAIYQRTIYEDKKVPATADDDGAEPTDPSW